MAPLKCGAIPCKTGSKTGFKVDPAPLDSFNVTVASGPHAAGHSHIDVAVEAVDAYDNRCSTASNLYSGTVKLTSSDGNVYFGNTHSTPTYVFTTGSGADNGYHVFTATVQFRTKGTHWLKARDESAGKEGSQAGIEVTEKIGDKWKLAFEAEHELRLKERQVYENRLKEKEAWYRTPTFVYIVGILSGGLLAVGIAFGINWSTDGGV